MFETLLRRVAAGTLACGLLCGVSTSAMARDVASTLESDARFSEYVSGLKKTGLWPALRHKKAVTIFAPTNQAFSGLGQAWLENLSPASAVGDYDIAFERVVQQSFLQGMQIDGSYPEDTFHGKVMRVRSASESCFIVDGTLPGKLVVNRPPELTIGFSDFTIGFTHGKNRGVTAGAPISADNGFIYPTDGFVAAYTSNWGRP
jgi:hypothetical protein